MTNEEMEAADIHVCAYRFGNTRVRVEWRGSRGTDTWAVVETGMCLNRDGDWEYEPLPSRRDEEFFTRCRFSLDEALRLALAWVNQTPEDAS